MHDDAGSSSLSQDEQDISDFSSLKSGLSHFSNCQAVDGSVIDTTSTPQTSALVRGYVFNYLPPNTGLVDPDYCECYGTGKPEVWLSHDLCVDNDIEPLTKRGKFCSCEGDSTLPSTIDSSESGIWTMLTKDSFEHQGKSRQKLGDFSEVTLPNIAGRSTVTMSAPLHHLLPPSMLPDDDDTRTCVFDVDDYRQRCGASLRLH